jgi:hypothetical protein
MIVNATILSYATAQATAAGKRVFADAVTLGGRCFVDVPTNKQRQELGASIEDATAVAYIPKSVVPAAIVDAGGFVNGTKLSVQVDGSTAARAHAVVQSIDRQKPGGLSHFETYLRVI